MLESAELFESSEPEQVTSKGRGSSSDAHIAATAAHSFARRSPHRLIWRSLRWWRYAGDPPWRQHLVDLVFFNPAPLDDALVAGIMTKEPK